MKITSLSTALLLTAGMFASPSLLADWQLDEKQSSLNFVSIKNDSIAEIHHFKSMQGSIDDSGQANLTIKLDSVETLIPIRNERMRNMLFETAKFPDAKISTKVDTARLKKMEPGQSVLVEASYTLRLHDKKHTATTPLRITALVNGGYNVASTAPIIVNATDYNLQGGLKLLQQVASLSAISDAVPVTLNLVFTAE